LSRQVGVRDARPRVKSWMEKRISKAVVISALCVKPIGGKARRKNEMRKKGLFPFSTGVIPGAVHKRRGRVQPDDAG